MKTQYANEPKAICDARPPELEPVIARGVGSNHNETFLEVLRSMRTPGIRENLIQTLLEELRLALQFGLNSNHNETFVAGC